MIRVRRLTSELQEAFLEFMDGPAFTSQPQWRGCYCQEYLNTASENAKVKPEQRRDLACERIQSELMSGYLAFEDGGEPGRAIGWLSANAHDNYRLLPPVGDSKVATIICFSIEKEFQGRGVATRMLEFALEDLANRGFKAVQAAPLENDEFHDWGYRGKLSMFLKQGFTLGPKLDEQHVLVTRQLV